MFIVFGIIGLCVVILLLMRNGDYEEQRILSPGIYEVGVEIRPGRCDLMAESGGGSFIIKNKKADCWNLGNSIGVGGIGPGRFRNVTLMHGDILEINGNVRVMLTPPTPIADLRTETLGPGIYRIGVDINPPAKYDFEAVSGSGEIILVDIKDNSFSIYQDMAAGHPQRAKTFDNVVCSRRYELWVNGSLHVKLKPSEHQRPFTGFRKTN